MPVYEYRCEKCQEVTEAIRRMDDADAPIACEHCGHTKAQRIHSVFMASADTRKSSSAPSFNCGAPGGCCGGTCGI